MDGKKDFYYNDSGNARDYIRMAAPYDGKVLREKLADYLVPGSGVLELGMGPGKDLEVLSSQYRVTGSDLSEPFVEMFRQRHPRLEVLILDACTIEVERKFDCIFSNKVLHHLNEKELVESLLRQKEILNPNGIIAHSFWEGDREEVLSGLTFRYYRKKYLEELIGRNYKIIFSEIYTEVFPDDSIAIIARRL
jgi:trans-aconitate methyltransferase